MAQRRIAPDVGRAAVASGDHATATRYLLQVLGREHPGQTIEVRVPPFGAVQCGEGLTHRRGTPPNVVEMDAPTWVALATGSLTWTEVTAQALVRASGTRADLRTYLPLREW